jgi:hypothetical protein
MSRSAVNADAAGILSTVTLPEKDTEERESRIAHGRPILGLGFALIGAGIVYAFVRGGGLTIALIVAGVLVCALWLLFPYLRGRIELSLPGRAVLDS